MNSIGVCGIGCRYAGADNAEELWSVLRNRQVTIGDMPKDRFPTENFESLTWKAGWLKRPVDVFDEALFAVSAREACEMDPCQRFVCEVVHEALYDARIPLEALKGKRVGVFVGAGIAEYMAMQFGDPDHITPYTMTGNSLAVIANRISFILDVHGPSMTVDTACSASSTAFGLAVRSIDSGDCCAAIVAGVNLLLGPSPFVGFSRARMLSVTGTSRPFDRDGNGFVRGEGCGAVVLARKETLATLSVAPRMYADVRAVTMNEDGQSQTLTEPAKEAQVDMYSSVIVKAGLSAKDVGYVEAHGTGTPVGDPIEASAIAAGVATDGPVNVGSIKANIGHCETAAGIAGIIKACIMLFKKELPPQAGFSELHADIDSSRIRVPTEVEPLEKGVVVCASYGFGGANVGVCLSFTQGSCAPAQAAPSAQATATVLKLASHKEALLTEDVETWKQWAASAKDKDEGFRVGSMLQRHSSRHRYVSLERAGAEPLVVTGSAPETKQPLVFAFAGQGSLTATMGLELYKTYDVFRKTIDELDAIYKELEGSSLTAAGFCTEAGVTDDLQKAAPATVFFQVAVVDLLASFGVCPDGVMGHSIGEVAAAYASDRTWSKRDLVSVVVARTRAQKDSMQPGAMAAVAQSPERVSELLAQFFPDAARRPEVVCKNDKSSVTIGGERAAMEECVKRLKEQNIQCKLLRVERAFHSRYVDEATTSAFHNALVKDFSAPKPSCAFHSTSAENADEVGELGAKYWEKNMRNPVNFVRAAENANKENPGTLVLEISPGPVLAGYLSECGLDSVCTADKSGNGMVPFLTGLAKLYVKGVEVSFSSPMQPATELNIPYIRCAHQKKHRSLTWKVPATAMSATPTGDRIVIPKDRFSHYTEHMLEGEIVLPGAATTAFVAQHKKLKALSSISFVGAVPLWASKETETLTLSESGSMCDVLQDGRVVAKVDLSPPCDFDAVAVEGEGVPIEPKKVYEALGTHCGLHLGGAFQSMVDYERVGRWTSRATVRAPNEGALDVIVDGLMQTAAVLCDLGLKPMVPASIGSLRVHADRVPREVKALCNMKSYTFNRAVADVDAYCGNSLVLSLRDVTLTRYAVVLPPVTIFDVAEQPVGFPEAAEGPLLEQFAVGRVVRILDETSVLAKSGLPENVYLTSDASLGGFDIVVVPTAEKATEALGLCAPNGRVYDWATKAFVQQAAKAPEAVEAPVAGPVVGELELGSEKAAIVPASAEVVVHVGYDIRKASMALAAAQGLAKPPTLVFVASLDSEGRSGALRGWARTARQENLQMKVYSITLGAGTDWAASREVVLSHVAKGLGDMELMYDGSSWSAPRMNILKAPTPDAEVLAKAGAYRLTVQNPGSLSSLQWKPVRMDYEPLGATDVRVEVAAISLHFKDLMLALGKLPFKPTLGMECSGVIVEVGSGVTDLAVGNRVAVCSLQTSLDQNRSLMATHAITTADSAVKIPDSVDLVRASGFLGVFATAAYALEDVARLSEGEWVLIHSAMGGVGQAAIAVATARGAIVIASAGSEDKRRRLREEFGVKHTIDSRASSRFKSEIMAITGGRGVDVVLNSLAGDGMTESMKCLAPMGRFVEIGKVDIFNNAPLPLGLVKQNITFHSVHLDILCDSHPQRVRDLLRRCATRFPEKMPEATIFDASEVEKALRYMQTGKHTGKVLVKMEPPQKLGQVAQGFSDALFDGNGTYVITGGNGGLGQMLSHWMVQKGARHLALVSRSGAVDRYLMPEGAEVTGIAADVSDEAAMEKLFKECNPPVRGVFHLAGVFPVNSAHELGNVDVAAALAAKVDGVKQLARAAEGRELTHFVTFSSLAAILGNIDQALYTAANVSMEQLTSDLRNKGLPAMTIAIPIVLGAGRLAQVENLLELNINTDRFKHVTSFDDLLNAVEPLFQDMARAPKVVLPMAGSMPKGNHLPSDHIAVELASSGSGEAGEGIDRESLREDVIQKVAFILGADLEEIEPDASLTSHGMDSLAIVELASHMQRQYNYTMSKNDVFQGLTLNQLIDAVSERCQGAVADAGSKPAEKKAVPAPKATNVTNDTPSLAGGQVHAGAPVASAKAAAAEPQTQSESRAVQVLQTSADVSLDDITSKMSKVQLAKDADLSSKSVTITVPKVFNDSSLKEVMAAVREHAHSVIVFRGTDGNFCQGMDLTNFGPNNLSEGLMGFSELSDLLSERKLPFVCVVEGPCAGGGMLFPCLATLVIATEAASFGFPEIRRGLLPGVVSVAAQQRLTASVCKRLMTFGDIIDAAEAKRVGLVDEVASATDVQSRLAAATRRLQSIEPDLLQAATQYMPAPSMEVAMVAMGGLDKRTRDRCRPDDELVSVYLDDETGVAVLELNDPERCNAMDWALSEDLRRATAGLKQMGNKVRAIVLQGAGEHFCVGVNPYSFVARCRDLPLLTQAKVTYDIYHSFVSIRSVGVPIICVVHGKVLGGGLAASLNADYRVATRDTLFNYGNMPRGVCPGLLLSSHLTEVLGFSTANALYMNDDTLTADDALASGLVHEVLQTTNSAKRRALEFAALIGSYSNVGVRATISLMRSKDDMTRLARESFNMARCFTFGNSFDGQKWKRNDNKEASIWLNQARSVHQPAPKAIMQEPQRAALQAPSPWDYGRDINVSVNLGRPRMATASPMHFLTGSTGFLGINILCDLQALGVHVVALVRADDTASALSRVKLAAASQSLKLDASLLTVVCGCVSKDNFGLSAEDYSKWTAACDVIVHNAAAVELSDPYESLKPVNVDGTKKAIKFAADGVVSTLVHVSSLSVFSLHEYEGNAEEIRPDPLKLRNGYSRSKWAAEQCVWGAGEQGLPVHVVRPGRIMGHSSTGCANMKDWFASYINACLKIGGFWDLDHETDMTAVDDVSRVVVDCACKRAPYVGKVASRRSYHAYSKNVLTAREIGNILNERGWRVRPMPFDKWVEALTSKFSHLNFGTLITVFQEINVTATQGAHINFSSDFENPIEAAPLMHKMLDWMVTRGLLPEKRATPLPAELSLPVDRSRNVGIHNMELYIPRLYIQQAALEKEHDCIGKYTQGLGQEQIGFCEGNEDAVSYALTAVHRLMERHNIDWNSIGRIDVGTESAVDRSKSIKSFICDLFTAKGVHDIEGADNIHACYGGTAAFLNACAWCESDASNGKMALVVAVDIANQPEQYLFMMGTGVCAMLVGRDAPVVLLPERASHSMSTWDFYKPSGWKNNFPIMLDGSHSVDCYMDCLDGCQKQLTQKLSKGDEKADVLADHDFYVFHCTSVYLCKRGFDRLVANSGKKISIKGRAELYEKKTAPACKVTKRNGSAYAASVYVCLYSLLENMTENAKVLVFSYGSGSLSSMYRFEKRNSNVKLGLPCDALLNRRRECTVQEFLASNGALTENYKKFGFSPEAPIGQLEQGVYYLTHVDEWGKRTYARQA